jgi:hypothetical protein
MYANVRVDGSCYNFLNRSHLSYSCIDEHAQMAQYHYGPDCTTPPSYFQVTRIACSQYSSITRHCVAPPPVTIPTSGSPIGLLQFSALFSFVAPLLLLLF